MPYRLKRKESIIKGAERIALEQFAEALRALTPVHRDTGAHNARKALKKLRALLRLTRSSTPDTAFVRENTALRDAGRALSPIRDADILVSAVRSLERHGATASDVRALLAHFDGHRRQVHRAFFANDATLRAVRHEIEQARDRLDDWKLWRVDDDTVEEGLDRSYRRARRTLELASGSPREETWHEWRKRTKDVWYHMRLLSGAWQAVLDTVVMRLDLVGQQLGEFHDLAILAGELKQWRGDSRHLRQVIERRRRELRSETLEAGHALFSDKPRHMASQFGAVWSARH